MDTHRIVTIKEFTDWVKEQPPEQPVWFGNPINLGDRVCPMVKFGRSIGLDFTVCYDHAWAKRMEIVAMFEDSIIIHDIFPKIAAQSTYGELQKSIG